MKRWLIAVTALGILVLAGAGYLYAALRALDVERLSDDLFVLRGLGGNVAVLRTDAGTVVVDTLTFPLQGARIRAVARELTGSDTVLVINTHYHLDHTHGNPAFKPGTMVLATERTLSHLQALDGDFWQGDAAKLLPNETFTDRMTLSLGGKRLELVHPGRGHTDGDLVVLFTDEGVIHMGDLLFAGHYPNIDLEAGGTVRQWPDTLDAALELPFDTVIPGHGPTTDRQGIQRFRAFLVELWEIGTAAAADGKSLEETLASTTLTADAGFEPIRFGPVSLGLDRAFVLQRVWEEATGSFERAN
jgi:glyoxylase-like metal-dependent hydrolase (beta-lactamase superfamily II)